MDISQNILRFEEYIKDLIKERIGNKTVEDLIFNPDSGRLLFYFRDNYTTKTGKTAKKWFELGVMVMDHTWQSTFSKTGINNDRFISYLVKLLEECNLTFGDFVAPISSFGIMTGMESFSVSGYKTIDLWNEGAYSWWFDVCLDEQFAEALSERIRELT